MIDMVGKKCGRLTVISKSKEKSKREILWNCVCDCGGTKTVSGYQLRSGNVSSCGCFQIESRHKKKSKSDVEIIKLFFSKVKKKNCWEWLGAKDKNGYGVFKYNGETRAHRWSFYYAFGKIPRGLFVCHKCDNPSCVNPNHLFLGTPSENSNDMVKKRRQNSKLSEEDRKEIAKLNKQGVPITKIGDLFGVQHRTIRYSLETRK